MTMLPIGLKRAQNESKPRGGKRKAEVSQRAIRQWFCCLAKVMGYSVNWNSVVMGDSTLKRVIKYRKRCDYTTPSRRNLQRRVSPRLLWAVDDWQLSVQFNNLKNLP